MILIINLCQHELHYYEFVKPIEDIIKSSNRGPSDGSPAGNSYRNSDTNSSDFAGKFVTKDFVTKHYTEISKKDIDDAHRIIITGTSLQDFEYSRHIDKFAFLRDLSRSDFRKPVLAICAGMQLLCSLYGCEMITGKEIGLVSANFTGEFLGMSGQREIYALHNMTIKDDAVLKENFHVYAKTNSTKTNSDKGGCVQAIKHKHSKIYGVLFHPEVRNEDMIIRFLSV